MKKNYVQKYNLPLKTNYCAKLCAVQKIVW